MLVVLSWLIAIGGESSEKTVVINRGAPFRYKKTVIVDGYERSRESTLSGDTIDAEFKVKGETDL